MDHLQRLQFENNLSKRPELWYLKSDIQTRKFKVPVSHSLKSSGSSIKNKTITIEDLQFQMCHKTTESAGIFFSIENKGLSAK